MHYPPAAFLYLLVVCLVFILNAFLLGKGAPYFRYGALEGGDLYVLLQLLLYYFLLLLQDARVEAAHILQLRLLLAQHALVLALHLAHCQVVDLQLRMLLLHRLHLLLQALCLPDQSLPFVLEFLQFEVFLVEGFLFEHEY